jgi:WD40 repeat protein
LVVVDVAKHKVIWKLECNPSALAFARDGHVLAVVVDPDRGLARFAPDTGKLVHLEPYPSHAIAVEVEGDRVFVGWGDGTISCHDVTTLTTHWRMATPETSLEALTLSPDGTHLAAIHGGNSHLMLFASSDGAMVREAFGKH